MNTLHIIHQFITCQTLNEARIKKMRSKNEKVSCMLNDDDASSFFDLTKIYRRFRLGTFVKNQIDDVDYF